MQVQTTTITTETMPVENINFSITTFEMKISAFCDCCDSQATGTKKDLQKRGWGFGNGSEFCSECNY